MVSVGYWNVLIAIGGWVLPIILSTIFAVRRNRHWALGFGLAFFLGWVGFLLLLLVSPAKAGDETGSEWYRNWTTRDLVVGATLSVAVGVVFWAWGLLWSGALGSVPFPLNYLGVGVWMIGGLLVPYVIRRPGAAFLGEVVAAFVSMAMGNQWGILTMASGLFQGACAEAVFATGRYKHFDGMWLYLAGAASGLSVIMDSFVYHYWSTYTGLSILVAGVFSIISSAVLGGGLSHLLGRSLTWTGVFSGLEISRGSAKRI